MGMNVPNCRLASYNLQKCVGMDLRRRPARSLHVIDALQAQIVVLQEADRRLPPRPTALPHDLIEAHGWRIVPLGQVDGSLGFHGNAILIRPGIRLLAASHIDLPGLEPRGAVRADLLTPIGPLRLVATHLGLIRRYRLMQVASLMRHLAELPPLPTVLAGDLNEWGAMRPYEALCPGYQFVPTQPSFPAPRPVARLDRFAFGPGLKLQAHATHHKRPARVASDHLPVWVELSRDEGFD